MSLEGVMRVSGSALAAHTVWLDTIASNLANSEVVSGSADDVYRSRQPIFATMMKPFGDHKGAVGVTVEGVVETGPPGRKEYAPHHALADGDGYIHHSNVNTVEEMANMIAASRAYQNSVEAMNTAKQLLVQTLSLGR
ncbi:MAG: flagellar basal body rod protein FlgC [Cellvibrionales bacterium]|nr:MAG: flagellar basal body rod protein FlgC [Cellvibrionales bacterium]